MEADVSLEAVECTIPVTSETSLVESEIDSLLIDLDLLATLLQNISLLAECRSIRQILLHRAQSDYAVQSHTVQLLDVLDVSENIASLYYDEGMYEDCIQLYQG